MDEANPLIAALEARIDNMTTEIARKLAWIQESKVKHHVVKQTLLFKGQPLLEGWFPILQKAPPNLVFAPLTESKIEQLCSADHSFVLKDGTPKMISFTRFSGFYEEELVLFKDAFREMRQVVLEDYLPALTFPFLPYSRKFIIPHCEDLPEIDISVGTFGNNELFGEIYSALKTNMYPVWNVDTDLSIDIRNTIRWSDVLYEGKYTWPLPEQDYTYIRAIHDTGGGQITDPKPVLADEKRVSTYVKPGKILYTYIHPHPERYDNAYPEVGIGPSAESYFHKYWSGFFTGVELTRSDVSMLLNAIPEIRQRLKIKDIKIVPISESLGDSEFFRNYLWFLEHREKTGKEESVVKLSIEANQPQFPDYFAESLGIYFASICSRVFDLPDTVWQARLSDG